MMAGLDVRTAFSPLQAMAQAAQQKQSVPIPLTFGRETYYDPMPVDRPLGELPVETYEWAGSQPHPVQPVGDVIDASKRFVHSPDLLMDQQMHAGQFAPQGGAGNVVKLPQSNASKWRQAEADAKAGTDFRMPLAQKQAAEAQTLGSLKQSNQAHDNKWAAWGKSVGADPNSVVKIVRQLRNEAIEKGIDMVPDNQIKFAVSLLMQKGQM